MGIHFPRVDRTTRACERRCNVKLKSLVFLAIFAIGALYLWHNYASHGGVAGLKSGVGLH
jgi:hypothetical protein